MSGKTTNLQVSITEVIDTFVSLVERAKSADRAAYEEPTSPNHAIPPDGPDIDPKFFSKVDPWDEVLHWLRGLPESTIYPLLGVIMVGDGDISPQTLESALLPQGTIRQAFETQREVIHEIRVNAGDCQDGLDMLREHGINVDELSFRTELPSPDPFWRARFPVSSGISPLTESERENHLTSERKTIADMLWRETAFPLLPKKGVYLQGFSPEFDGREGLPPKFEGQNFVGQFLEVWGKLPGNIRQHILARWRKYCPLTLVNPTIELSNEPVDGTMATTDQTGCILTFYSAAFEIMPDEVGKFIIAHELLHVAQIEGGMAVDPGATATRRIFTFPTRKPCPEDELEVKTHMRAKKLGFNWDAFVRWISEMPTEFHGLSPALPFTDRCCLRRDHIALPASQES